MKSICPPSPPQGGEGRKVRGRILSLSSTAELLFTGQVFSPENPLAHLLGLSLGKRQGLGLNDSEIFSNPARAHDAAFAV